MSDATTIAISGGVGGAKLSLGLDRLLGGRLTVVVNTGDDFEHIGLHVSPDIDTAIYTLADIVNPETGWGRRDETWSFMAAAGEIGLPTWFKLGDRDLAMHAERTRALRAGEPLSSICERVAARLGIASRILPMSDDPVRTVVDTDAGTLEFQRYFVREQCRPAVTAIRFEAAERARMSPAVRRALADSRLAGIVICPSNPYLSVDPVLAVPGMREALKDAGVPIIAVSPIVGGKAIKGPAAKIMAELGVAVDAAAVARHYAGLIDGFVLDTEDAELRGAIEAPVHVTNTVMRTLQDKIELAGECLQFCAELAGPARSKDAR